MSAQERLIDLFEELDRQTVVPHDLHARISVAASGRRHVPVLRIAVAIAACVIALVLLPLVFNGEDGPVVETTPLATVPPGTFDTNITSPCTAAARALTAVEPRFATAAAYRATSERFRAAVDPLVAALVAALPPRDDVGLPSRVVAEIRTAEARVSTAARLAGDGDLARAGDSFTAGQRAVDDALRALVTHGARCSNIGTED